jgi:hypothetical protein
VSPLSPNDQAILTASLEYLLRRRASGWWSRVSRAARWRGAITHVAQFNYTLSAALDLGTLLCVLFIFLTLGLPNVTIRWWGKSVAHREYCRLIRSGFSGNDVYQNTYDWVGLPYLDVPAQGFGPDHCKHVFLEMLRCRLTWHTFWQGNEEIRSPVARCSGFNAAPPFAVVVARQV